MAPFGPWPGEEVVGGWPGPNQNLASQAAWFIDPIAGSNNNEGKTLATALQTRSEFARRTWGMILDTISIAVNIESSLLAGDEVQPFIFGNNARGLSVNYVAVPTAIVNANVSDYVAANPATNQVTQLAVAALPGGSWTAAGLLNKTIEFGNIRATVIADLGNLLGGHPTAWISPPINGTVQGANFAVGNNINVWQNPNCNDVVSFGGYNTYKYIEANSWLSQWGRTDRTNCSHAANAAMTYFSGVLNDVNCYTNPGADDGHHNVYVIGTQYAVFGGYSGWIAAKGNVNVKASTTCGRCHLEQDASLTTAGQLPFCNLEVNAKGAITPNGVIDMGVIGTGLASFSGFVYGTSDVASLVGMNGVDASVTFANLPTVTGATTVTFATAAKTELLSRLGSIQLNDNFGNRLYGPPGPILEVDRLQLVQAARGVIAETVNAMNMIGAVITVNGTVYYQALGLRAGDVITNLSLFVQAAGVAMTRSRVGLYDVAGNLLAQSADQGASWAATGLKTIALTAPFTILTTGAYYAAVIAIGGTQPTLSRGSTSSIAATSAIGGGIIPFFGQTGQADLPNPAAIAAGTVANMYWLAAS